MVLCMHFGAFSSISVAHSWPCLFHITTIQLDQQLCLPTLHRRLLQYPTHTLTLFPLGVSPPFSTITPTSHHIRLPDNTHTQYTRPAIPILLSPETPPSSSAPHHPQTPSSSPPTSPPLPLQSPSPSTLTPSPLTPDSPPPSLPPHPQFPPPSAPFPTHPPTPS